MIAAILISVFRLSMLLPAITQQKNLRGIYQTSILCLPPRRGCTWSVFSALIIIIIARGISTGTRYLTSPLGLSAGVNFFANPLPARQNIYVFPPLALVVPDFHFHIVLDVLHDGSSVTYNGTFGLFDVSASDLTAFVSPIRSQVARI